LPDTATADEVRLFQLHLVESGASICNRNRVMTGVRFLFRVTLRRHDLAAEIWHMKEPQKLPPVPSPEEIKRILNMATSPKARAMLSLAYGCGLRASEVARLRACDIDSDQMIIRVVQSKGRKDWNVMLPAEILDLLRQWWKARPKRRDAGRRGLAVHQGGQERARDLSRPDISLRSKRRKWPTARTSSLPGGRIIIAEFDPMATQSSGSGHCNVRRRSLWPRGAC
jgi:integrase